MLSIKKTITVSQHLAVSIVYCYTFKLFKVRAKGNNDFLSLFTEF